jgi:hypothetical protein
VRRAFAATAAAVLLCGCGTPGADLFVAVRSGSGPGAALRLRVIDDGQVVCNGAQHDLPSRLLISARELATDLADAAKAGTSLAPGPGSVLRYRIRTEDGTVRFADTSRGQPPAFYRAAFLVHQIAVGPCGLPR